MGEDICGEENGLAPVNVTGCCFPGVQAMESVNLCEQGTKFMLRL